MAGITDLGDDTREGRNDVGSSRGGLDISCDARLEAMSSGSGPSAAPLTPRRPSASLWEALQYILDPKAPLPKVKWLGRRVQEEEPVPSTQLCCEGEDEQGQQRHPSPRIIITEKGGQTGGVRYSHYPDPWVCAG